MLPPPSLSFTPQWPYCSSLGPIPPPPLVLPCYFEPYSFIYTLWEGVPYSLVVNIIITSDPH